MHAAAILTALADLAPAGAERIFDVSGTGRPLVWLSEPDRGPRGARLDRLAALDALHRDERILRRGLVFLVGGADVDGARRRIRLPLLAQPVRLERHRRGYWVEPAGDLELTPLIEDRDLAARLEAAPGLAGPGWLTATDTAGWITTAAEAAGLTVDAVVPRPPRSVDDTVLTAVAAAAIFVSRDVSAGRFRDTLRGWAGRPGLPDTALSRLYLGTSGTTADPTADATGDPVNGGTDDVLSPLPLNDAQREVVRRVRTEPVVVVSGAPGNGKSHALVAAALDAVGRGGSVLVATQSVHAAEVLGELLRRHPGPPPVLFGDAERRGAIAADLTGGVPAGVDDARLRADAAAVAAARDRVSAVRAGIVATLELERLAAALPGWQPLLPALSHDAPAVFEPGADLAAIRAALDGASRDGDGWWRSLRRAHAARRLRRLTGAAPGVPMERLRAAVDAADTVRAAARLSNQRRYGPDGRLARAGRGGHRTRRRGRHRPAAPGHQRAPVDGAGPAGRQRSGHRPAGRAQPPPGTARRAERRRPGAGPAPVGRHGGRRRGPVAAGGRHVRPGDTRRGGAHRPAAGRPGARPGTTRAGRR
ncbi:AAA family ATPase [Micromonospora sp. WMMD1082]|uniref:AAA family ATPase n=1 Tax=Micromonospora sp. WMMD1082 TaxID=3016104 RepID=UPI002415E553|nr:AAA family ATPase [Micromonospora sp. WMMD1082]MDG4797200.1 AAA family ATPase [Micromonospora sp. WMMD1082]